MRSTSIRSIVATVSVLCLVGLARAANNPAYDSWAKVKPGSSVTMKTTTEASGQKTDMEMTYTLSEVTPDDVSLQMSTAMVVAGTKMNLPPQKVTISRTAPASGAVRGVPATGPTDASMKSSDEKLTIDGKSYDCKVVEGTQERNGMKITSKTWTCLDVPNTIVKAEAATTGTVASKTLMQVVKIDLK